MTARRAVALNPRGPLNHPRDQAPPAHRIVAEMRADAITYFDKHGHKSPIGHWLWNLAGRMETQICPDAQIFFFPTQRREGNT